MDIITLTHASGKGKDKRLLENLIIFSFRDSTFSSKFSTSLNFRRKSRRKTLKIKSNLGSLGFRLIRLIRLSRQFYARLGEIFRLRKLSI